MNASKCRLGAESVRNIIPVVILGVLSVSLSPLPAAALTLYGGSGGTATLNWLMPTTVDPDTLTITSLTTYTKEDNGTALTGTVFQPDSTTVGQNYGLQINGNVHNPITGLTSPVVAVQICFAYTGTINIASITDPNINSSTGKPYVPWSISGYVSKGEECFLFRQQPGSADLDIGAWYAVLQGKSTDPAFASSTVSINGYTVPPPVPEASSVVGLLAMITSAAFAGGLRRRTALQNRTAA